MSERITMEDLQAAMREVEAIQRKREEEALWDDELFEFIKSNRPHRHARGADHVTWQQLAAIVTKHKLGSYKSGEALAQAFKREEIRRNKLEETNNE